MFLRPRASSCGRPTCASPHFQQDSSSSRLGPLGTCGPTPWGRPLAGLKASPAPALPVPDPRQRPAPWGHLESLPRCGFSWAPRAAFSPTTCHHAHASATHGSSCHPYADSQICISSWALPPALRTLLSSVRLGIGVSHTRRFGPFRIKSWCARARALLGAVRNQPACPSSAPACSAPWHGCSARLALPPALPHPCLAAQGLCTARPRLLFLMSLFRLLQGHILRSRPSERLVKLLGHLEKQALETGP